MAGRPLLNDLTPNQLIKVAYSESASETDPGHVPLNKTVLVDETTSSGIKYPENR